jgi:hypothetical protein
VRTLPLFQYAKRTLLLLNYLGWLIIHAILQGIANPASLQALLGDSSQKR